MKKSLPGVYMILNTTTCDRYIGSSPRRLSVRWSEHKCKLRKGTHGNPILQEAWNKYGENAFVFVVLENTSKEDIRTREQYWMEKFRSDEIALYNRCPSAFDNTGLVMSEESIKVRARKQSEIRQGWSDERKREYSEKMKAMMTDERKKLHSELTKKAWRENKEKMMGKKKGYGPYRFRSPEGEVHEVDILSEFCRQHGLSQTIMLGIHKGDYGRKSNKGWTKA